MKTRRNVLYPGKKTTPTWAGVGQRLTDTSGIEVGGTMNLSTPIVSAQDGPRLMGISNFGGKKAAPFRKGGKRRAKVLAAKTAVKKAAAKSALKRDNDNDGD